SASAVTTIVSDGRVRQEQQVADPAPRRRHPAFSGGGGSGHLAPTAGGGGAAARITHFVGTRGRPAGGPTPGPAAAAALRGGSGHLPGAAGRGADGARCAACLPELSRGAGRVGPRAAPKGTLSRAGVGDAARRGGLVGTEPALASRGTLDRAR